MKRAHVLAFALVVFSLSVFAQQTAAPGPDDGVVTGNRYTNSFFGFSFEFPKGWTVHGDATNKRIMELGRSKMSSAGVPSAAADVAEQHTHQLLTVFQHPLGTPGVKLNPAVMVIAEDVSFAPGIQTGRDYLENLRSILGRAGYEQVADAREITIAGKPFTTQPFATTINGIRVMQTVFCTVTKGYALVFMYMGNEVSVPETAKGIETLKFSRVLEMQGEPHAVVASAMPTPPQNNQPSAPTWTSGAEPGAGCTSADASGKPVATRVRISQGLAQSLLVEKTEPVYPPLAQQARIQGQVVLRAIIGCDGHVQELRLVSGHPMLAPAAMDAVKQWRYKPYLLSGSEVEADTTVTVNFTLQ